MEQKQTVEEAAKASNLANYSMDFEIGSTHWFNTLMSTVARIGEFMAKRPDMPIDLTLAYGDNLYAIAKDMIEWRAAASLPTNSMPSIIEKYKGWCKETKRGGAVLIGGSINEFFDYLESAHT